MRNRKQRLPNPPADIMTVLAAIATVFFLLAFGGKAVEAYRVQRYNAMLDAELAALQEEHESLKARLKYVQTPAYIEQVAREQYKWVKPGENLVIPIFQHRPVAPTPPTTITPSAIPATSSSPYSSYWPEWFNLLKGKR
ncbi:MAG: septum formation initiator family protein [Chloroflexi bacterium]|nr:septum formation initiator family protein [Chloroflexota bacterium]